MLLLNVLRERNKVIWVLCSKNLDNERFCKTVKDKKQRYDDMSPLSNANERDHEPIYIGNEGVKHNTKFEEQMN